MPGGAHGSDIVEHLTFGLGRCTEIGRDLLRLHYNLAEKQNSGADNIACQIQHPCKCVDLREIAAIRPKLLPDIRDCIQPDHIHPAVCEEQQIIRHVIEDHRISVIQVPLVGIEKRHDDFSAVIQPCKVTGRGSREDLRHRLLILIRNVPVVKEEVSAARHFIPCSGSFCPCMVFTRVIHHKVKAQADPLLVADIRQLFQIFHGAEFRLHAAEIRHGISTVAPLLYGFEQRHQMQVIDTAFLQIGQLLLHSLQSAGKCIHIHHHPQKLIAVIPVWVHKPFLIENTQRVTAFLIITAKHFKKIFKCSRVIMIKLTVKPLQFVVAFTETFFHFFKIIHFKFLLRLGFIFFIFIFQFSEHFTQQHAADIAGKADSKKKQNRSHKPNKRDAGKPEADGKHKHQQRPREEANGKDNCIFQRSEQSILIAGKQGKGIGKKGQAKESNGCNTHAKNRSICQCCQVIKIQQRGSSQEKKTKEYSTFEVCTKGMKITPDD